MCVASKPEALMPEQGQAVRPFQGQADTALVPSFRGMDAGMGAG